MDFSQATNLIKNSQRRVNANLGNQTFGKRNDDDMVMCSQTSIPNFSQHYNANIIQPQQFSQMLPPHMPLNSQIVAPQQQVWRGNVQNTEPEKKIYKVLQQHMTIIGEKEARDGIKYVAVLDELSGMKYIMCSSCGSYKLFRDWATIKRHLRSQECMNGTLTKKMVATIYSHKPVMMQSSLTQQFANETVSRSMFEQQAAQYMSQISNPSSGIRSNEDGYIPKNNNLLVDQMMTDNFGDTAEDVLCTPRNITDTTNLALAIKQDHDETRALMLLTDEIHNMSDDIFARTGSASGDTDGDIAEEAEAAIEDIEALPIVLNARFTVNGPINIAEFNIHEKSNFLENGSSIGFNKGVQTLKRYALVSSKHIGVQSTPPPLKNVGTSTYVCKTNTAGVQTESQKIRTYNKGTLTFPKVAHKRVWTENTNSLRSKAVQVSSTVEQRAAQTDPVRVKPASIQQHQSTEMTPCELSRSISDAIAVSKNNGTYRNRRGKRRSKRPVNQVTKPSSDSTSKYGGRNTRRSRELRNGRTSYEQAPVVKGVVSDMGVSSADVSTEDPPKGYRYMVIRSISLGYLHDDKPTVKTLAMAYTSDRKSKHQSWIGVDVTSRDLMEFGIERCYYKRFKDEPVLGFMTTVIKSSSVCHYCSKIISEPSYICRSCGVGAHTSCYNDSLDGNDVGIILPMLLYLRILDNPYTILCTSCNTNVHSAGYSYHMPSIALGRLVCVQRSGKKPVSLEPAITISTLFIYEENTLIQECWVLVAYMHGIGATGKWAGMRHELVRGSQIQAVDRNTPLSRDLNWKIIQGRDSTQCYNMIRPVMKTLHCDGPTMVNCPCNITTNSLVDGYKYLEYIFEAELWPRKPESMSLSDFLNCSPNAWFWPVYQRSTRFLVNKPIPGISYDAKNPPNMNIYKNASVFEDFLMVIMNATDIKGLELLAIEEIVEDDNDKEIGNSSALRIGDGEGVEIGEDGVDGEEDDVKIKKDDVKIKKDGEEYDGDGGKDDGDGGKDDGDGDGDGENTDDIELKESGVDYDMVGGNSDEVNVPGCYGVSYRPSIDHAAGCIDNSIRKEVPVASKGERRKRKRKKNLRSKGVFVGDIGVYDKPVANVDGVAEDILVQTEVYSDDAVDCYNLGGGRDAASRPSTESTTIYVHGQLDIPPNDTFRGPLDSPDMEPGEEFKKLWCSKAVCPNTKRARCESSDEDYLLKPP